jgi:restriction system protein
MEIFEAIRDSSTARVRLADVLLSQLAESGRGPGTMADSAGLQQLAALLESEQFEVPTMKDRDAHEQLLEKVIEERIIADWQHTPFADAGVQLHTNPRGEVVGQQFLAGSWKIDLLGWQEAKRCWWVIELKKGRASDKVVGQVARYMGWVVKNISHPGDHARGVILARTLTPSLEHACFAMPDIDAWTFDDDLEIHAA